MQARFKNYAGNLLKKYQLKFIMNPNQPCSSQGFIKIETKNKKARSYL